MCASCGELDKRFLQNRETWYTRCILTHLNSPSPQCVSLQALRIVCPRRGDRAINGARSAKLSEGVKQSSSSTTGGRDGVVGNEVVAKAPADVKRSAGANGDHVNASLFEAALRYLRDLEQYLDHHGTDPSRASVFTGVRSFQQVCFCQRRPGDSPRPRGAAQAPLRWIVRKGPDQLTHVRTGRGMRSSIHRRAPQVT